MILSTTLAVLAAAAPEVTRRGGGGGGGGSCNADVEKQVCCDGILSCVVQALSSGCSNTSFCCKTDAPIVCNKRWGHPEVPGEEEGQY